jgi:hypothetical protein
LQSVGFVTGKRPSVFWGYDLGRDNDEFLKALDPGYFEFVARDCAARLEDASALTQADRFRVATALRLAYGQAAETLLALLCASTQAPWFPMGWMARYRTSDLCDVVRAIQQVEAFPNALVQQPVTWRSISASVHGAIDDEDRRKDLSDKFAALWKHVASAVLADSERREYNALKHGLRVSPGGFSASVSVEKAPGVPAAAEEMQSLGGAEFGSSFIVPIEIDGAPKNNLRVSRVSQNWSPASLVIQLQLMACSMGNVISYLRICGGADASEVRFRWPAASSADAFARYGTLLHGVSGTTTGYRVTADDIDATKGADVLAMYDRHSSG